MSQGFASNSSVKQSGRGATLGTATSSFVGVVRVDGTSILVDQNGTISAAVGSSITVATSASTGLVRSDNTSIAINSGILSIATSSNGYGYRTISSSPPSGGNNGDIWYQV